MGHSFHKMEFLKIIIFVMVAVIIASGIGVYFLYDYMTVRVEEEELLEQHIAFADQPIEAPDPVEAFLKNHFAVTRFNEVNSIHARGSYRMGELEVDIELLAKQPRYYKQIIRIGDRVLEVGFDGEELWYKETARILNTDDPAYLELTTVLAMLECAIPCLAWEYENGIEAKEITIFEDFEILPDAEWDGRDCFIVKNMRLLDVPVLPLYRKGNWS